MTTITIPPPTRVLSPNGDRHHWTKVSAAKKDHRALTCILAKNQKAKKVSGKVWIGIDWFMADKSFYCPLDKQNAIIALKAAIDGLADAGVIDGDGHKIVDSFHPVTLHRTRKEHQGRSEVVLTIRSAA